MHVIVSPEAQDNVVGGADTSKMVSSVSFGVSSLYFLLFSVRSSNSIISNEFCSFFLLPWIPSIKFSTELF